MNKIIDKVCHIPTLRELIHGNFKQNKDPFLNTGRDTLGTTVTGNITGFKNLNEVEYVIRVKVDHRSPSI